jgi:subtilisin family serine protease
MSTSKGQRSHKPASAGKRSVKAPASRNVSRPHIRHVRTVAGTVPVTELPEIKREEGSQVNIPALQTTGKYIIIYKPEVIKKPGSVKESLSNKAGIHNFASTSDFKDGAIGAEILGTDTAVHFEHLGMALVANEDEAVALSQSISDADSPILAIEPEYIAYPTMAGDMEGYLRGYRDAINNLWDSYKGGDSPGIFANIESREKIFKDTDSLTWGLQATKVNTSKFSGRGIRIALLDTGFDINHPDFRGRHVTAASFSGVPVDDIHGHGTHCIGTACGPQNPATGERRYGVAYNAEIFAGKVF